MPIKHDSNTPPVKVKSGQELTDAISFYTTFKGIYFPNSVLEEHELILLLVGYKNYLTALYGLGLTSPASGSAIAGSYYFGFSPTGSLAAATASFASGII
jgi:hypothetical protein